MNLDSPTCVAPHLRDPELLVYVNSSAGRAGDINLNHELRRRIGREVYLPSRNLANMLNVIARNQVRRRAQDLPGSESLSQSFWQAGLTLLSRFQSSVPKVFYGS